MAGAAQILRVKGGPQFNIDPEKRKIQLCI